MPNEVIGICPVCSQPMEVTELECPVCHTKISGNFQLCKFCSLTPEQKGFAEVFIKNLSLIHILYLVQFARVSASDRKLWLSL